jgi:hypothetical protein
LNLTVYGSAKRSAGMVSVKRWWEGLIDRQPDLFAQWKWVRTYRLGDG